MRDYAIQGIGTMSGGEFNRLDVEGVGTNYGDIVAEKITIEGVFKSTGNINAQMIECEGVADFTGNIRTKHLLMEGVLNIKDLGKIEAEQITGEGCINAKSDINADCIKLRGCVNAKAIYGDQIEIDSKEVNFSTFKKILQKINLSDKSKASNIEVVEATTINLTGVCAKEVNGHDIIIGPFCEIGKVDCTGTLKVHETAVVGTITGVSPTA